MKNNPEENFINNNKKSSNKSKFTKVKILKVLNE